MDYKKIFWGIILVAIGLLIILKNTGAIWFDWLSVLRLWPVLLILWGISIIPVKSWIRLLLSLAVVFISIMMLANSPYSHHYGFRIFSPGFWQQGFDWDEERTYHDWEEQQLSIDKDSTLVFAELEMNLAAGHFDIMEEHHDLVSFEKRGYLGDYELKMYGDGDTKRIKLQLERNHHSSIRKGDEGIIKLNPKPIWDFDIDMGAASIDFDLSTFKTRNIKIDGGASSLWIKLGDRFGETKVDIDSGVSSLRLSIPEASGCEIKTNTVLSSKAFQGFDRIERHLYRTPDFDEKDNKVFIIVEGAISSINISRY